MPRFAGLFCVLALGALASACDSDQPLQAPSSAETVVVTFRAEATSLGTTTVWDTWFDSDLDGVLDLPNPADPNVPHDDFLGPACLPDQPQNAVKRPAPWAYSVRIQVVRAQSTAIDVLTATSAATTFNSVTDADQSVPPPGPDVNYDPGTFTFYVNPRSTYSTTYYYIDTCMGPVALPDPGTVGGLPAPVAVELAQGETLMVEAALDVNTALQVDQSALAFTTFSAEVRVNGALVTPDGIPDADGAGARLQFSYTNR